MKARSSSCARAVDVNTKMSKCRTWNDNYFFEVHASKKPEEADIIPALGQGRGKPLKDVASLSLPKVALKSKAEKHDLKEFAQGVSGTGRGQVLKERALSHLSRARRPGERNRIRIQVISFDN